LVSRRVPGKGPGNPGVGAVAKVDFRRGEESWSESINLVESTVKVLTDLAYEVTCDDTWVRHPESELAFRPQFVALYPLDNGGVRTVTTVETRHPTLVPDGVFEFQHATGNDVRDSIVSGLDQWARIDLVTFLDALKETPASCMTLRMTLPADGGRPARYRRAVLGPIGHFAQNPPAVENGEEHPFCPCCLLTRSMEAFKELFTGESFYALRFFASRDPQGRPEADCRVNGENWPRGAAALTAYARTWPAAGFEFRKQYVILQNMPDAGPDPDPN
jgi:hypothetical protein